MPTKKNTTLVIDSLEMHTDGMTELDGILSVPAVIAKHMVYDYGGLKVLKPFDELEAAAKFADGIPITLQHPNAGIVTDRAEVLGFLKNPIAENDELKGILEVSDKDLIADIKADKVKSVSGGFFCNLDYTSGMLDGVSYDAIQRGIFMNHVATLDADSEGRCSLEDGCGLLTDSKKIDSTPYLTPAPVPDPELAKVTAERDALKADLEKIIKTEKDTLIAELVAAQDSKTKEDLEKLRLDELTKELDMVHELRTDRLSFGRGHGSGKTAVDDAYAKVGRKQS